MSDHDHTGHGALPVEEAFLHDWAAEGLAALERYLAKHAAFALYLARRSGVDSGHGDGAIG